MEVFSFYQVFTNNVKLKNQATEEFQISSYVRVNADYNTTKTTMMVISRIRRYL